MLCIADYDTQARDKSGKIRTFKAGDVFDFEKCPTNFSILAEAPIDLATVNREALLESNVSFAEIAAYAAEFFGVKIKKATKDKVVDAFIDARFRHLDSSTLL